MCSMSSSYYMYHSSICWLVKDEQINVVFVHHKKNVIHNHDAILMLKLIMHLTIVLAGLGS